MRECFLVGIPLNAQSLLFSSQRLSSRLFPVDGSGSFFVPFCLDLRHLPKGIGTEDTVAPGW